MIVPFKDFGDTCCYLPFFTVRQTFVGTFLEVHRWGALHDKECFSLTKIVLSIAFSFVTLGERTKKGEHRAKKKDVSTM